MSRAYRRVDADYVVWLRRNAEASERRAKEFAATLRKHRPELIGVRKHIDRYYEGPEEYSYYGQGLVLRHPEDVFVD